MPSVFYETKFADPGLGTISNGPRYRGGIDGLAGSIIRGWVVDLARPAEPLPVDLFADSDVVYQTTTGLRRFDLDAYLPDNLVGFAIDFDEESDKALGTIRDSLRRRRPASDLPSKCLSLVADSGAVQINIAAAGVTDGACLAEIEAILERRSKPSVSIPTETMQTRPAQAQPDDGVQAARTAMVETPDQKTPSDDWGSVPTADLVSAVRYRIDEEHRRINVAICVLSGVQAHTNDNRQKRSENTRTNFSYALVRRLSDDHTIGSRVKDHAHAIAAYFDPWFYSSSYLEYSEDIDNPLLHYVLVGFRDGNLPHPLFDPLYYRSQVEGLKGDPLLHFVRSGAESGLNPHPLFDSRFYRSKYLADQPTANSLAHYLEVGGALDYDPSPLFSTAAFYRYAPAARLWPNALEAFSTYSEWFDAPIVPTFDAKLYRFQWEVERGETLHTPPLVHYLGGGYRDETLLPNLLFDPQTYREKNELALDEPALLHYLREGDRRGLQCHAFFSAEIFNAHRGVIGDGMTALEWALAHPHASYQSERRMSGAIDCNLIAFLRRYVDEWGQGRFDVAFYKAANRDVVCATDGEYFLHYANHGQAEGRIASPTDLMRHANLKTRELSLGFVSDEYITLNSDLDYLRGDFIGALCHFALAGLSEGRMFGKWQFYFDDIKLDLPSARTPLTVSAATQRSDVCILIHAFYPDLLPELAAFAQNFRNNTFDIFINVVDLSWTPDIYEQLRATCPGAFVQLSNDSGRDIGGFTRLLHHIDIARYEVFAFMHSKKSPHIAAEVGEHWRRALLRAIAGSPEVADQNIELFKTNRHIGMIGCKEWRSTDMGKNVAQYEILLDLLGIKGKNRALDYVSGFMFLIRGDIVKALYQVLKDIEWEYGGDNVLEFHLDGQIAHGVERAVPALVRHMGYDVVYR